MIYVGTRLFDVPFWDGNMFRPVTISCTNDFVMSFLNFLYGVECHLHLIPSFIFWMDHSMSPMCHLRSMCVDALVIKMLGAFIIHDRHGIQ